MKLEEHKAEVSGNLVASKKRKVMGIDPGSMRVIIDALTKGLYSDPYTVILREYTSNALDAHKAAGVERAVEVTLPTPLSPSLIIRDWGTGMGEEELDNYSEYGWSTKRDTNEAIGAFGLGSKSGLAVANAFTVVSVKDGRRRSIIISMGEEGPEADFTSDPEGKVTNEPNGTQVVIPTSEHQAFRRAVDHGMFKAYKPGSILVDGEEPLSIWSNEKWVPIYRPGEPETEASLVAWHVEGSHVGGHTSTEAFVGPVRYSIEWDRLIAQSVNVPYALRSGYLASVAFNLPNGAVTLPRNRETITYDARTVRAIGELVDVVIAKGREVYEKNVADASTLRQAILRISTAHRNGFLGDYEWNGNPVVFSGYPDNPDLRNSVVSITDIYGTGDEAYINRRSSSSLGYYSPQEDPDSRGVSELIRENLISVLVTEAGELAEHGINTDKHKMITHAAMYMRSEMNRLLAVVASASASSGEYGGPYGKRRVYFTSQTLTEIDPLTVQLFTDTVTGDEFMEIATAKRKALMAQARADRKARGESAEKDPAYRVVFLPGYGYSRTESTTLGNLPDDVPTVILKRKDSPETDSLIRLLTTDIGRSDARSRFDGIERMVRETGAQVLVANKSWKTEKWADYFSDVVTIDELFVRWEAVYAQNQMTDTQLKAARDRSDGSAYWVRALKTDHIAEIKSDTTREWIEAALNTDFDKVNEFMTLATNAGFTPNMIKRIDLSGVGSYAARYPILTKYGTYSSKALRDYINMTDYMHQAGGINALLSSNAS